MLVWEATHRKAGAATMFPLGGAHRNHIKCPVLPHFRGNDEVVGDRLSGHRKDLG